MHLCIHCMIPHRGGLPHSDTPGSKPARGSSGIFAACHVLHRLLAPRHPPDALLLLKHKQNLLAQEPSIRRRSGVRSSDADQAPDCQASDVRHHLCIGHTQAWLDQSLRFHASSLNAHTAPTRSHRGVLRIQGRNRTIFTISKDHSGTRRHIPGARTRTDLDRGQASANAETRHLSGATHQAP